MWTSLLEMPATEREFYLHRLVQIWPFKWERLAFTQPLHALTLGATLSAGYTAARINADLFLLNPQIRVWDSLRKCPYTPVALALYSSGLGCYALQRFFVFKDLVENEDHPRWGNLLAKVAGIQVATGVVLPIVTIPHLCYYVVSGFVGGERRVLGRWEGFLRNAGFEKWEV